MTNTAVNGDWAVMPTRFRILVVGLSNICRSPLAERMLQYELDVEAPGEFTVRSAGTQVTSGRPAVVEVLRLASRRGIRLHGFVVSQLDEAMISEADLILVMDRALRRQVVKVSPRALRTTFTLREFARILPTVRPEQLATPTGRWQSLVALAPRYRTPLPGDADDDDVIDPHNRPARAYERMNTQIVSAIDVIREWEVRGCGPDNRQ
ncbi:hypothetical protein FO013_02295 [Brevibacterium aurantiacum]|uniref:Phosphotyrosine protein phosphatase I domain-containing protein n=2 Tax=Brevibacterium aurantiacum TaxID=273384 RepID=A0A556CQU0_BREAU|nr:hypothetical protein FO013_02295 [Brevibacterium aurantiacum]